MYQSGPSMSVPGVYGAPDNEPNFTVADVQQAMREEPEVAEAIDNLVYALECSIHKGRAFDAMEERLFAVYLRVRGRLEDENE